MGVKEKGNKISYFHEINLKKMKTYKKKQEIEKLNIYSL